MIFSPIFSKLSKFLALKHAETWASVLWKIRPFLHFFDEEQLSTLRAHFDKNRQELEKLEWTATRVARDETLMQNVVSELKV